ncbi:MAG TPA: hypothetical protein DHU63_07355, partial [Candidatus Marinimicrobia bacterium]|nr:hypothetical protein [Candidatus Neomarinimicrobiota bacterium]
MQPCGIDSLTPLLVSNFPCNAHHAGNFCCGVCFRDESNVKKTITSRGIPMGLNLQLFSIFKNAADQLSEAFY